MNKLIKMIIVLSLFVITNVNSALLGTEFTYQGELKDSANNPLTGQYDFVFTAYDTNATTGTVLGTYSANNIQVTNGVFTTTIDFGDTAFVGDQVWMEIQVAVALSGSFTALTPLQPITATPYATHAQFVGADAVTTIEIQDGSITAADLGVDSVGSSEISANAVGTSEIDTGQVQKRVIGSCGVGEYISSINENGTVDCATDIGITSVTGFNIVDLSIQSVDLADGAVNSNKVLDNSLTVNDLGVNSVGASEIINTQVQSRVFGSCQSGYYLSAINMDGSVQCSALQVSNNLDVNTFGVQNFTNLVIRPISGFPLVIYSSFDSLRLFDCANTRCSSGTDKLLVNVGPSAVLSASIAMRNNNMPIISYYDNLNGRLNVYDCSDVDCNAGSVRILDLAGVAGVVEGGMDNDVAIGHLGYPIISYYDIINDTLRVYSCSNVNCSAGSFKTLSLVGGTSGKGKYSSITIRPTTEYPIISYYDETNKALKVYSCLDVDCSTGTDILVDSAPLSFIGRLTSIEIDDSTSGNNFPIISYETVNNDGVHLTVMACNDAQCLTNTKNFVVTDSTVPNVSMDSTAIAIRNSEGPIISYSKQYETSVYNCYTSDCSHGRTTLIDSNTHQVQTDIVINNDGIPIISYNRNRLGVHSCSDENCNN